MAKKQVKEEPKKSFEEQVIIILDKLAKREVGVDIDIAALKAQFQPAPVAEEETDEEPV